MFGGPTPMPANMFNPALSTNGGFMPMQQNNSNQFGHAENGAPRENGTQSGRNQATTNKNSSTSAVND